MLLVICRRFRLLHLYHFNFTTCLKYFILLKSWAYSAFLNKFYAKYVHFKDSQCMQPNRIKNSRRILIIPLTRSKRKGVASRKNCILRISTRQALLIGRRILCAPLSEQTVRADETSRSDSVVQSDIYFPHRSC